MWAVTNGSCCSKRTKSRPSEFSRVDPPTPGTGYTIKLFKVSLPGATDINGADSLQGLDRVRPARKTLLLNLDELGIPLDNVEGLTFGPRLPHGRQSVVLVSDNNFAASQFTQFLLFTLDD